MIALESELARRLKSRHVRMDTPDPNSVLFHNVPADRRVFNKPRTNLLLKRPQKGLPFLVCVDEDLEYTGEDRALARAFAGAHHQQGWRVLLLDSNAAGDLEGAVEEALAVLGFDDRQPALRPTPPCPPQAGRGALLTVFGADLSRQAREGQAAGTIGRDEAIEQVMACLLAWQPRLALIAGAPGVGKTNLLQAVAQRLGKCRPSLRLVAVDLALLFAGTLLDSERENLLATLLKEAAALPDAIVALEHLELAVLNVPRGPLLLSDALDRGVRLIGTTLPAFLDRYKVAPLARRLDFVELPELTPPEALLVLRSLRQEITQHYRIQMGESVVTEAVERCLSLAGYLPAKAIALLDAAAARAALASAAEVSLYHIYLAATLFPEVQRK